MPRAKAKTKRKKAARKKSVKARKSPRKSAKASKKPPKRKTQRKKAVKKKTAKVKIAPKRKKAKVSKKKTTRKKSVAKARKKKKLVSAPNFATAEPDIATLLKKKKTRTQVIRKGSKPKLSPHIIDLKKSVEVIEDDVLNEKLEKALAFQTRKLTKEEIKDQFTNPRLFVLPAGWKKALAGFIIFALFIAGPIQAFSHFHKLNKTKNQVMELTKNAYSDLKIAGSAVSEKNMFSASRYFSDAENNFSLAKDQLNDINILLQPILKIIPYEGKTLSDAENLLEIGQNLSYVGEKIAEIFNYFYNDSSKMTEKIINVQAQINELVPIVQDCATRIDDVNPKAIPAEFTDQFDLVKEQIKSFNQDLQTLNSFSEFLLNVLGHEQKKRYLIVFQNNRELRPTGGFMGSLALVDFFQGEIKNIEIPGGGTYDYQGTLYERLIPPEPLLLVNDLWQFQDANWFYDFETSAKKIEWFFQKAGGATVDGIITVNATLIEELLQYIPAIEMTEYGKIIDADNFINETQKAVELEYDRQENKPKQFIAELTPKVLESVFNATDENLSQIMKTLNQSFAKKEIQIYMTDPDLQSKVRDYNWAGEIKQTSKDYLAVVSINLRGGKTDHVIDQDITLNTQIDENGYITNTVTIKRTHLGQPENIFENITNNTYLKIFVPRGSQLMSASGFTPIDQNEFFTPAENAVPDSDLIENIKMITIDPVSETKTLEESGKTVFANWVQTPVGQTSEVSISYILPFHLNLPQELTTIEKLIDYVFDNQDVNQFYSLFVQKQSGSINNSISATIELPENYQIKWIYPKSSNIENQSTALFESDISTDELFGLIFEPNDYE